MEYTVELYESGVNSGRTMIHETTICSTDMTTLKREVTKLSKTLEPFEKLQKECPIGWESYGYAAGETFIKRWTPYTTGYPLSSITEDKSYTISISKTSGKFKTAEEKVYKASSSLKEAHEALTNNNYAFNPDISKIDPEIAEIMGIDLPKHFEALMYLVDAVKKHLQTKIDELNEKE